MAWWALITPALPLLCWRLPSKVRRGCSPTLCLDGHCLCSWNKLQKRWHLSSCTESPLGRRTPKPQTACHEPPLCWFSEAPKAVKSAQGCTYFLQRLTLGLHYHCRPLLNRHGRGKEWEDSKGKAEESKRAAREWCLSHSPGEEDVGNR